jgi:hypothetical protein
MRLATAILLAFLTLSAAPAVGDDHSKSAATSVSGDTVLAMQLSGQAAAALYQERWEEAAALLELAHAYADGSDYRSLQDRITFFWAYALYKQGESIVRANTSGDLAEVERALELFTAAMGLVNRLITEEDRIDLEVFRLSEAASGRMVEQLAVLDSLRYP